jgi:hypothetical protein
MEAIPAHIGDTHSFIMEVKSAHVREQKKKQPSRADLWQKAGHQEA